MKSFLFVLFLGLSVHADDAFDLIQVGFKNISLPAKPQMTVLTETQSLLNQKEIARLFLKTISNTKYDYQTDVQVDLLATKSYLMSKLDLAALVKKNVSTAGVMISGDQKNDMADDLIQSIEQNDLKLYHVNSKGLFSGHHYFALADEVQKKVLFFGFSWAE